MLAEKLRAATSVALPIEYVGGYAVGVGGSDSNITITFGGNLTGGLASSASAGDLVVVYFGTGSTADRNLLIRGYTEVVELYSNDSFDTNLKVAYKFMGATPDTNFVLEDGTGSSSDAGAVAVQVWRNVDKAIPFDVLTTTATGTDSVLCNPPAITPITAGSYIVAGGAGAHNTGTQTFSSSNLTSFISVGQNDSNDVTIGLGYNEWTSGAFDPDAFTFSGSNSTSYSWAGVTLALRPTQNQTGPFAISTDTGATAFSTTSLVLSKPTGTREGDLMIAMMAANGATSWTGDTDWIEIADQTSAAPALRVAYKVAGPSEGASYTFTSGSSRILRGILTTYRNGAYDAIGALTTSTSISSTFAVDAVTSSVDYARIYAAVAQNASSVTITQPATMEEVTRTTLGAPSTLAAQNTLLSYAGSSGTRTFSGFATTSDAKAGVLTSIKPPAAYTKYANYIDIQSASFDADTGVTVPTPECVPGNLLLFVVTAAINTTTPVTVSTPLGWTRLVDRGTEGVSFQPALYVFFRVVDGSENSSYSASATTTCTLAGSIVTLAGVDVSTLTASGIRIGSSTTSIIANGVTATNNGILLYFGAQANNNNGAVSFTPPSGMTEAADTPINGASTDLSLEVAYQEGLSSGATGTKTATASSQAGTDRFAAVLVTVSAL
jgi:hypothetical protein